MAVLVAELADFKKWLRRQAAPDTASDDELTLVLESATRWAEWRLGGPLSPTVFSHKIYASGGAITPLKTPLISVTSITSDYGGVLDASAYVVDTRVNLIRLLYGGCGWYDSVYTAGQTTIQANVKLAGMEVARHLWRPRNGSAGRGQPEEEMYVPALGFAIPNRAEELISVDPDHEQMPGFA